MKSKKLYIYADGGSRGNPGPSGIGVVILDSNRKKIKESFKFIGETTNNIAEYSALVSGLEAAVALKATDIVIYLDSELLTKQLNGEYKVRDANMKILFNESLGLLKKFDSFEVKHIARAKNKEADKLVNKAINLAGLF
ncbi:MAG: ribonuclease HI family protein [Candidatus Omnitrophica bacterium]|nr:ribonuclease HI family protein [Candidatus Omnitrophota bacterium]MBU0881644.1 ribonuclease HI family protein [Candidatus Omnitrophota bacterium]MBU1809192.1 ribonuclease HI family protein [Candidatus Omnitrophota bacterium]